MPRKSRSYDKHVPAPDPKYGSVKYAKFINYIMERGKKNVARKIFYDALEIVGEKVAAMPAPQSAPVKPVADVKAKASDKKGAADAKSVADKSTNPHPGPLPEGEGAKKVQEKKLDGRAVFDIALKNVAPIMELKSRRIGGANYQVPMEVQEPRKTTLAMRWLLIAARSKKGIRMCERLAGEIMDAYNKTGIAMKKREDVHRMAEANKAFAHFARFGRR
jgi:small subunit ribosomal protein S7